MGKRAPKAGKAEKVEKVEEAEKVQKVESPVKAQKAETTTKRKDKKKAAVAAEAAAIIAEEAHFEVFSPKFYETLETFKNFYSEVLALKSKEQGTDLSEEFSEVTKRVSDQLEEESHKILKTELADLQNWVSSQQEQFAGEIKKIEQAYKNNSNALSSTGSFSDEEIRQQLLPVQSKIDEKQAAFDSYGELIKRSKAIYE